LAPLEPFSKRYFSAGTFSSLTIWEDGLFRLHQHYKNRAAHHPTHGFVLKINWFDHREEFIGASLGETKKVKNGHAVEMKRQDWEESISQYWSILKQDGGYIMYKWQFYRADRF